MCKIQYKTQIPKLKDIDIDYQEIFNFFIDEFDFTLCSSEIDGIIGVIFENIKLKDKK